MSKVIDINTVEIPDVGDISLFIKKGEVRNGLGKRLDFSKLTLQFNNQLREVILALRENNAKGKVLYIPDFWHICYGDAVIIRKEQADQLWNAACLAHDIGKQFCKKNVVGLDTAPPYIEPEHQKILDSMYRIAAGAAYFF